MKIKTIYTCQNCGAQFPKWMGKCTECNQWGTVVEEAFQAPSATETSKNTRYQASWTEQRMDAPLAIKDIQTQDTFRAPTQFKEFDRVLGGGVVPGSLVLIGGDPGIGKSTILMQAIHGLKQKILYVSGEESPQQIKMRADRLRIDQNDLYIFAENQVELILEAVQKQKPQILVIDSIQTLYSSQIQSAPGSVAQVRECTAKLMVHAKSSNLATFIIGHVTKEGSIAGPKVLEHMVDTVLYFEGSHHLDYRILRTVKNRFGSAQEIGVFEMNASGLREVSNPSELFLQDRSQATPGTVVVPTIEGSRPVLVEIQALVSASQLNMPRRTALGVDQNKVSMLIAILEKKLGLPLYGHDLFVNVAGGIELNDPGSDLAIVLAIISSFKNQALDPKTVACGEVSLTGEIRKVSQLEMRLTEAERLGFQTAFVPQGNLKMLEKASFQRINIIGLSSLKELTKHILS